VEGGLDTGELITGQVGKDDLGTRWACRGILVHPNIGHPAPEHAARINVERDVDQCCGYWDALVLAEGRSDHSIT
jgi:hypothetical protein